MMIWVNMQYGSVSCSTMDQVETLLKQGGRVGNIEYTKYTEKGEIHRVIVNSQQEKIGG
jgi:hypothetical protein